MHTAVSVKCSAHFNSLIKFSDSIRPSMNQNTFSDQLECAKASSVARNTHSVRRIKRVARVRHLIYPLRLVANNKTLRWRVCFQIFNMAEMDMEYRVGNFNGSVVHQNLRKAANSPAP